MIYTFSFFFVSCPPSSSYTLFFFFSHSFSYFSGPPVIYFIIKLLHLSLMVSVFDLPYCGALHHNSNCVAHWRSCVAFGSENACHFRGARQPMLPLLLSVKELQDCLKCSFCTLCCKSIEILLLQQAAAADRLKCYKL